MLLAVAWLSSLGYFGSFRYAFRWLLLFHFVLGLLGGRALQQWPTLAAHGWSHPWSTAAACLGCWGLLFVAVSREIGIHHLVSLSGGLDRLMPLWACSQQMFAICALWILFDLMTAWLPLQTWIPLGVMSIALLIPWVYRGEMDVSQCPALNDRVLSPGFLSRDRLYFAFLAPADVFSGDADNGLLRRFGDTPMYANVKFVNGYSTMIPTAMARLLHLGHNGYLPVADVPLLKREVGPQGLFSLMGVEGIVLSRDYLYLAKEFAAQGWKVVRSDTKEALLHRQGPRLGLARAVTSVTWAENLDALVNCIQKRGNAPAPAVLLAAGGEYPSSRHLPQIEVTLAEETRLSVRCHVHNPSARKRGWSCSRVPGIRIPSVPRRQGTGGPRRQRPAPGGLYPCQSRGGVGFEVRTPSVRNGLLLALTGLCLSVAGPGFVRWRRSRHARHSRSPQSARRQRR